MSKEFDHEPTLTIKATDPLAVDIAEQYRNMLSQSTDMMGRVEAINSTGFFISAAKDYNDIERRELKAAKLAAIKIVKDALIVVADPKYRQEIETAKWEVVKCMTPRTKWQLDADQMFQVFKGIGDAIRVDIPMSRCYTYAQLKAMVDTVMVLADRKYLLDHPKDPSNL